MKEIKIYFIGFWESFDFENNFITNSLKKRFRVIIDENPDYLFFTRFDSAVYKYNCVRIFYNAENFAPDFNLCDYALGFDEIQFGDRYLRYPLYLVPDYTYYAKDNYAKDFQRALDKSSFTQKELEQKEGFCSIVVSRSGCQERESFFEKLSEYKNIASGGRWNNNVGGPVEDKFEFNCKYKFSIAFENSSTPGYTTEKLMQAFGAKTIPIYFGNPHIDQEFNEKAFINVHKYNSWEDVIEEVKKIDQNDDLYMEMMQQDAFLPGLVERKHQELDEFLWHIVEQDIEKAVRRQGQLIKKYEKKYMIGTKLYVFLTKLSFIRNKIFGLLKNSGGIS